MVHVRLVIDSSAAARLAHADAFLGQLPPGTEALIVATTRLAADSVVRARSRRTPATFGLHRFSVTQLAARLAARQLAVDGLTPSSALGAEAIAARAVFEADRQGAIAYLSPVVDTPGLPRALARTIGELREARCDDGVLASIGRTGGDLAALMAEVHAQLLSGRSADRRTLFDAAIASLRRGDTPWSKRPILLLDAAIDSLLEREFFTALLAQAPAALVTAPAGDERTVAALAAIGVRAMPAQAHAAESSSLARLRKYLFSPDPPPAAARGDDVRVLSAPGEGREAIEIARRVLGEARRGVRFDEMAVLVRGREYVGLLEHAFARAGIPAYFEHGTRRPHPAGRALLALLACADEDLSARRFSEYLSLAQVPAAVRPPGSRKEAGAGDSPDPRGTRPLDAAESPRARPAVTERGEPAADRSPGRRQLSLFDLPVLPADDVFGPAASSGSERTEMPAADEPSPAPDDPIVHGALKAPWRWEDLIIESHVIAGRARWRRLDGLAAEYTLRLEALRREGEHDDSPRAAAIRRDLENLAHLRAFALPIVDELAAWPDRARWTDWLARLEALVPRVLREPVHVLRVLAELRPLGEIGPVTLREVRDVLSERLRSTSVEPPAYPYGRVAVGSPDRVRGRTFRVVFTPGLAERMFPQRLRDDPLLDDADRARVSADLTSRSDRVAQERLRLQLAVGAAGERLYLSYPRLEIREARPRVPSFYALDVIRAMTGRVPGHEQLEAEAARESAITLAWPAPADSDVAVDEIEHDLAVLRPLLHAPDPASVKGRAHYLLTLNDNLRRSLTARWKRWHKTWSDADGVLPASPAIEPVLASQRLSARPYSLSALQRYSACPYQFLLGAIYRFDPFERPEPLQSLDPLTRGALFHAIQAECLRTLKDRALLPVRTGTLPAALDVLDWAVTRVSDAQRELLAPAIDRVWHDQIAALRRDLRRWMELMAQQEGEWIPERFELAFGLRDEGHDPASVREPVRIGRFILRGAVDLIERHMSLPVLRVTDHKTGRCRAAPTLQVGGGAILQPVLYSLAVEQITGTRVFAGRLWYCTSDGGFAEQVVELGEIARRHGVEALEIIDRAIEHGFLAAAPRERACQWCDFRAVCGPLEEVRFGRKTLRDRMVGDLLALRELP
jgi:CRISPR/Cas system-associated exonuclease Cas4 (RecB family)